MYTVLFAIVIAFIGGFIFQNKSKAQEKIFGVYSQPGKWYYLKWAAFYLLLNIRALLSKFKKTESGLGTDLNCNINSLEICRTLSEHEKAFDAVFFQAVNSDGYYLCGGIERRHHAKVNGIFYIVVPELGLLRSEHLPKTELDADPISLANKKGFAGGGIHFTPIVPMKKWKMSYTGKMWIDDPKNMVDVEFEADWTSDYPYFMFDSGMSKCVLARAIAKEEWSKEFFESLKSAHQTHYEQMGNLKGILTVNGKKQKLEMKSFRDHSFGNKRDWALMHRYAFHMIYLEDKTRICVGVISQPCTTSHLEMGYVIKSDKIIHPIENSDLRLYQHGENGKPGKDIAFTITADSITYEIQAITKYECEHFKGNDVEARLIERFVTYQVNGVRGTGISEWHYNNLTK